tara:strand:+ start:882 stop:1223 length:342 start_codon:yes stop_codon:yes gene_type:complete
MEKNDFALYKKDGKILSMGFQFKNLLTDNGLPAMIGGGKGKFHKSDFGIPVGLALLNKQLEPDKYQFHRVREGGVLKEDLYRKLLHLGEQRKSTKSKTKKKRGKRKKKTRKLK